MKMINVTPTWEGLMPGLLNILETGNKQGKEMVRAELMDLARNVDKINAMKLKMPKGKKS